MFRDKTIKQRLVLGFGSVLVLIALVSAVATVKYSQVNHLTRQITGPLSNEVAAASDLAMAAQARRTALRGYVLSSDQVLHSRYRQAVADQQAALADLRRIVSEPDRLEFLADIDRGLADLAGEEERVLQLVREGNSEAFAYHQEHVRPLGLDITDAARIIAAGSLDRIRVSTEQLDTISARLKNIMWAAFVGGLLMAIVFAAATIRSVAGPARDVARAAAAIAGGDYSQGLSMQSAYSSGRYGEKRAPRDELKSIAVAMAEMSSALQRREQRLLAHAQISSVCASTIELDSLMNDALGELARHTDTHAAAAYVAGDQGFSVCATFGISPEPAGQMLTEPGGFVEEAARSGKPMLISDIPEDVRFVIQPGMGTALPRSMVCVPMVVEGRTLGVVVLASLHLYDQEAMEMMQTAAAQIGTGLSNVLRHLNVQELAGELQDKNELLAGQNEELQCQNEESQAQSEELQAQSEEMQAQNEELLSQSGELKELNSQLQTRTRDLSALQSVTAAAISGGGQEVLLNQLLSAVTGVLDLQFGLIMLLDESSGVLRASVGHNILVGDGEPFQQQATEGFSGRIFETRELLTANDAQTDPLLVNPYIKQAGVRALVGVPIAEGNRLYGVGLLGAAETREFSEGEKYVLTAFGARAAAAIERERSHEDQRTIAETLQKSFLPKMPPVVDGYQIADAYLAAGGPALVGGDFYDLIEIGDGKLGLVIADVCGKGVGAAIHTAMLKYMLRAFVLEDPEPGSVVGRLNSAVMRYGAEVMVTLFYGVLEVEGRRLVCANAGHVLPLLYKARTGACVAIESTGPAFGITDGCAYKQTEVRLDEGDAFVLYTDGITEARRDGGLLGQEGLESLICGRAGADAFSLAEGILAGVNEFCNGDLRDDVALVVVKPGNNAS